MRTRTNRLRTPIRDRDRNFHAPYLGRKGPEIRSKSKVQKSLLHFLRSVSLSASVCANLVFATPRFRFSGLEPPASRFFVSNTGCVFMPAPAPPLFVLLQPSRSPNTHSPFVQLAAMNDDSCNNKSNNNISNFCIPAIIACPSRRMRSMLGTAANTIVATTPC